MRFNGWRVDLAKVPIDEPFLVFLAEQACGSRVHVATKKKISNGYIMIVGGYFADDMPPILLWHEMITLPELG